jgi:Domain of unknown function (DUF4878)
MRTALPRVRLVTATLVLAGLMASLTGAHARAQAPAGDAAKQTATQFYMAYRAAFDKAKSIEEVLPYMAEKNRKQVESTPKAERAKMFEMIKMMGTLTNVKVIKEARTPDGGATLTVEALDADKKKATGTVEVIKEGGAWKLGGESWKS